MVKNNYFLIMNLSSLYNSTTLSLDYHFGGQIYKKKPVGFIPPKTSGFIKKHAFNHACQKTCANPGKNTFLYFPHLKTSTPFLIAGAKSIFRMIQSIVRAMNVFYWWDNCQLPFHCHCQC